MAKNYQSLSKAAELQITIWFLEAGWEVFTPVVDANQTDFVVRVPTSSELLALQIKSTQRDSLNAGQLNNRWRGGETPFDYLIFIEGARERGVVFQKQIFTKYGATIFLFKDDDEGYPRGEIRPVFAKYAFNLSKVKDSEKPAAFVSRFLEIHTAAKNAAIAPVHTAHNEHR